MEFLLALFILLNLNVSAAYCGTRCLTESINTHVEEVEIATSEVMTIEVVKKSTPTSLNFTPPAIDIHHIFDGSITLQRAPPLQIII